MTEMNKEKTHIEVGVTINSNHHHHFPEPDIAPLNEDSFLEMGNQPLTKVGKKLEEEQKNQQRSILKRQAMLGLGDIMNAVKLIIIFVTIIKIPFLLLMILRNQLPNTKLSKKLFGISAINQSDKKLPFKLLSLEKCISISFKELMKDLPLIPFAFFLLVLAPWRILNAYYIIKSQVERISTYETETKNTNFSSRFREVLSLIWVVCRGDIPYFIRIVFMILSIIRIPVVVKMVIHYLRNVEKYQRGDLSFIRGIDIEAEKAANLYRKILSALMIVLCMWRLPKAIKRFKAYKKTYKEKMLQMRYKQHEFDATTKEKLPSLNDITWDTYGKICQFLCIQDLARLSQVSRKFYALNQKDFYWEYQFKRDWSNSKPQRPQRLQRRNVTFKEKCVKAFKRINNLKKSKEPLTREQRDNLGGPGYFLYDEAVKSLRSLPRFLLLPAKLLGFVLHKVFKVESEYFPLNIPIRNPRFVDLFRCSFQGDSAAKPKKLKSLHFGLFAWIIFFGLTYVCEVGLIGSYICCFFIRITSAGETKIKDFNEFGEVTYRRNQGTGEPVQYQNRFLRFLLYPLQFVVLWMILAVILAGLAIFPFLFINYLSWEWYEGIFGPCFIFLLHYCAMGNIIYTTWRYAKKAAIYYRPYRLFTELFAFIKFLLVGIWKKVLKQSYDKMVL